MSDNQRREQPQEWLTFAEVDLEVARESLARGQPRWSIACYHAQQAAEKYLKAYLVSVGVDFPRTHDTVRLVAICAAADSSFEGIAQAAAVLTDLGTLPRYPSGIWSPTGESVREALVAAETIAAFVRSRMAE